MDEEFIKQHPVSQYHGTELHEGIVVAKSTNPNIKNGKVTILTEQGLCDLMRQAIQHQYILPVDSRNAAQLSFFKEALAGVQSEKQRLGLKLKTPRLIGGPVIELV